MRGLLLVAAAAAAVVVTWHWRPAVALLCSRLSSLGVPAFLASSLQLPCTRYQGRAVPQTKLERFCQRPPSCSAWPHLPHQTLSRPPAALPTATRMASPAAVRPAGKVEQLGPDCFAPRLVYNKQLVPLGEHATRAAAEAAYDLGKMLVSGTARWLPAWLPAGGATAVSPPTLRPPKSACCVQLALKLGGQVESLKLHQPASAHTANPLWQELAGPHRTFEKACSLLATGAAAGFLPAVSEQEPGVPAVPAAPAAQPHPPATEVVMDENSAAWAGEPAAEGSLGRAECWIEFPHGSRQYCMRLSETAAWRGRFNLPGGAASCPSMPRLPPMPLRPLLPLQYAMRLPVTLALP
jgi:hypothetical protein